MSRRDPNEDKVEETLSRLKNLSVGGTLSKLKAAASIIGLFILIICLIDGWVIVAAGQQGAYTRTGDVRGNVDQGFHTKMPVIDRVHTFNTRSQEFTRTAKSGAGSSAGDGAIDALTKNGLNIRVDITVRYHIKGEQVDEIYEETARNEDELVNVVLKPTVQTAVRSTTNSYSSKNIYSTQREEFASDVEEKIRNGVEDKGIVIEEVQVKNIRLPDRVKDEIEKKQATEQRQETKENELEIARLEKQRKVIEAEGIAKSNQIIGSSLSESYLNWYFIQEGLEKGDTIYMIPAEGGTQPTLTKDIDNVPQNTQDDAINVTATGNGSFQTSMYGNTTSAGA